MLNISKTNIAHKIDQSKLKAFQKGHYVKYKKVLTKIILVLLLFNFILLFLPWTQNISSYGNVTTLQPDKRPQEINSVIAGKVEKWYVKEGMFVNKGDTIINLSEVRDAFFDPNFLLRNQEQLMAKEVSAEAFTSQVEANDIQIAALNEIMDLRIQQANNKLLQASLKVKSDSIRLEAAKTNFNIAKNQYTRIVEMFKDGLKSETELEDRKNKLENVSAKLTEQKNKLENSKTNLLIAKIEVDAIQSSFNNKIAKSKSDRFTSKSSEQDAFSEVFKFKNIQSNLQIRKKMYFITAPQSGYVTQITKSGIGEVFNEGDPIVKIMPSDYELAVEMYVKAQDINLFDIGQKTRIVFDGWPSIIFSGWPNVAFGTFGGEVVAIDRYMSPNGKFRVMVAPDKNDVNWPGEVNVGSGAQTITLLKNVPVWWELWRQINGFPDSYYKKNPSPLMEKVKMK